MPVTVEKNSIGYSKKFQTVSFPQEKGSQCDNDIDKKVGVASTAAGGTASAATAVKLKKASTIMKKVPLIAADQFTFESAIQMADAMYMQAVETGNSSLQMLSDALGGGADVVQHELTKETAKLTKEVNNGSRKQKEADKILKLIKQKLVDENIPKKEVPRFDAKKFPLAIKPGRMGTLGAVGGLAVYGTLELFAPAHKEE